MSGMGHDGISDGARMVMQSRGAFILKDPNQAWLNTIGGRT